MTPSRSAAGIAGCGCQLGALPRTAFVERKLDARDVVLACLGFTRDEYRTSRRETRVRAPGGSYL
jgi:hypothetical protein